MTSHTEHTLRTANRVGHLPGEQPTLGAIPWLVVLRWAAVAGQLGCVLIAKYVLRLPFDWTPLLLIILAVATSNAALYTVVAQVRRRIEAVVGTVLLFDTLALTGLLYLSSGVFNPFTVLYLVQITLSAVVLESRWTWIIAGLSMFCFALLFPLSPRTMHEHQSHGSDPFSIHLLGMWFAFCVAAALITFFVHRIKRTLSSQEAQLAELREMASKASHLASLTTLVAGAAHELGTPLSTIAVAATEMKRSVAAMRDAPKQTDANALQEDAELIAVEAQRCRAIIERMAYRAGQDIGAMPSWVAVGDLVQALRDRFPSTRIEIHCACMDNTVWLAQGPLLQALESLVNNALDASEDVSLDDLRESAPVELNVNFENDVLSFEVRDHGSGMAEETLRQATIPFFTTKVPGRGLGLGLFLVQTYADQARATFSIESGVGNGTKATLRLPLARVHRTPPAPKPT